MATSIIASKKGESEISVGNVLGSNIFNITVVVGIIAIIPLFYQNPALNLNLEVSEAMLNINIPIQMSDEEISRKSVPELIELAKRIMDEIEIRAMQEAGEEGERNAKK